MKILPLFSKYYDEVLASRILTKGIDLHLLAILAGLSLVSVFSGFLPFQWLVGWLSVLIVIMLTLAMIVWINIRYPQKEKLKYSLLAYGFLHTCVATLWGSFAFIAASNLDVWQCMFVLAFLYLVLATPYARLADNYPIFASGVIAKTTMVVSTLALDVGHEWRYQLSVVLFVLAAVILLVRGRDDALANLRALQRDPVTGLPNRKAFSMSAFRRLTQGKHYGIVVINLRQVGFISGTAAWEAAIVHIADQLRSLRSADNYVARYSENYFVMAILDHDEVHYQKVASKLLTNIGSGISWAGDFMPTEVSAGIAVYPNDSENIYDLIEKAHLAADLPPDIDTVAVVRYQPSVDEKLQRAKEIRAELEAAISKQELRLFYQPKVNLETGLVTGAEALIRWDNAKFGWISPVEFVPIAEESGLITEIGEWVVGQAACDLKELDTDNAFSLAVNVSVTQFSSKALMNCFVEAVKELPKGKSLEIEITESVLMSEPDIIKNKIMEFSRLGIKVALDDFGTGYSSLRYITELAVDKLKIDQSFVKQVPKDPMQSAIVQAIISLSRAFNVEVIAEGIETESQAQTLKKWSCNTGQGYYYGKPMPKAEFNDWLKRT